MRRIRWLLVLSALLGGLYWWAAVDNRMPADAGFALDLAEVRRLASSDGGPKPTAIRFEKVTEFSFPAAMVDAGAGWSAVPMSIYAYQIEYPDRTVILDTALAREVTPPKFMVASFDDAAYNRVSQALSRAALIAVTHEHADHIGGITQHPDLAALLPALRLTREQLAEPWRMRPIEPPAALAQLRPLEYDRHHLLAPGLVLIKAPGHTPGTQLAYVQLADGRELLFLGDVAWHALNVREQRQRPRWVTGPLIREARDVVFGQLKTLHALAQQEPALRQVPGHDGAVVGQLAADGWLVPGFEAAPGPASQAR